MELLLLAVCRQARQDALALLATCATSYGAASMRPHLVEIWNGLRPVLTAGIDSSTAPDERAEVSFCGYSAIFSSKHEGSKSPDAGTATSANKDPIIRARALSECFTC